jgi:hypothetical protein
MYTYVIIDGFKYAVQQGTYMRKWVRQFTANLVANLVELNFIDRGPGIKTYDFSLHLASWDPSSEPYKAGITQTALQQMTNLENSYEKVNTAVQFIDPLGNPPDPSTPGVYFTNLTQRIPDYSTNQKIYFIVDVEIVESLTAI